MLELGYGEIVAVHINTDRNHWSEWSQLPASRKAQY
jgi:hypothetical protein